MRSNILIRTEKKKRSGRVSESQFNHVFIGSDANKQQRDSQTQREREQQTNRESERDRVRYIIMLVVCHSNILQWYITIVYHSNIPLQYITKVYHSKMPL